MYALNDMVTYFDSFGAEHIPKETKIFINIYNLYLLQIFLEHKHRFSNAGCFCIFIIGFTLAGKNLKDFTNIFSPNDFKENDDIILKHFMTNV